MEDNDAPIPNGNISIMLDPADQTLFLFVPANRPERFAKAAGSRADAVILDLEDAVAPAAKDGARAMLVASLSKERPTCATYIRINGVNTSWHADDIAAAAMLGVDGVFLPKSESAADVMSVRRQLATGMQVLSIVETARGLATLDEIAATADRLVFGSLDLATDLGCAHQREPLAMARSRFVLAARLADTPAPIDGVTLSIKDEAVIEADARYGASFGFGGKLLIHPAQIMPARRGFAPTGEDFAWATTVVANASDGAARAVDGTMVDAPVLARARQIVAAYQRFANGS